MERVRHGKRSSREGWNGQVTFWKILDTEEVLSRLHRWGESPEVMSQNRKIREGRVWGTTLVNGVLEIHSQLRTTNPSTNYPKHNWLYSWQVSIGTGYQRVIYSRGTPIENVYTYRSRPTSFSSKSSVYGIRDKNPPYYYREGLYRYGIRDLRHLYNPMSSFRLIRTSTLTITIIRLEFYPCHRT